MRNRFLLITTTCLLLVLGAVGCGGSDADDNGNNAPTTSIDNKGDGSTANAATTNTNTSSIAKNIIEPEPPKPRPENLFPLVDIVTNLGTIRVKLNAEKAPMTVDNFLMNYVERKFYSGTIFHYVEKDFIAIAGGYTADMKAKPVRSQIRNEATNGLKNKRGTIAMSRRPDYINSATSQFFFNLADNESLDHQESKDKKDEDKEFGYCVFGEIVKGIEVLDQIAAAPTKATGDFPFAPTKSIIIQSIVRVKTEVASTSKDTKTK